MSKTLSAVALSALILLAGCGRSGTPAAPGSALPNNFDVHERAISLTTTLDVVADGTNYGTIEEAMFSLTTKMTYKDAQGNVIATARGKLLSLVDEIDIYDANGKYVGKIRENFLKSLTGVWTTYNVFDAAGNKIAESDKVDLASTSFTLKDANGVIATLHRPWLNWPSDTWSVSVDRPNVIPNSVLVIIAGFKTTADNNSSSSSSDDN